jgi:hypothetical protein
LNNIKIDNFVKDTFSKSKSHLKPMHLNVFKNEFHQ